MKYNYDPEFFPVTCSYAEKKLIDKYLLLNIYVKSLIVEYRDLSDGPSTCEFESKITDVCKAIGTILRNTKC
jgi:hypothetical protein